MVVVSTTVFGQQDMPLKFGIELDGKLKKVDPGTGYDSPTGAVHVGMFAELHLTNHISGKLSAGLNNTYYNRDAYTVRYYETGESDRHYETGESESHPAITKVKQTLGISLEPRFYFFSTEQFQKINIYAAVPVTFESIPFRRGSGYEIRSELMILPSLGCRYDFNKNWGIEASGGLGWARYFKKYTNILKMQEMTYGLNVGIRYTF